MFDERGLVLEVDEGLDSGLKAEPPSKVGLFHTHLYEF